MFTEYSYWLIIDTVRFSNYSGVHRGQCLPALLSIKSKMLLRVCMRGRDFEGTIRNESQTRRRVYKLFEKKYIQSEYFITVQRLYRSSFSEFYFWFIVKICSIITEFFLDYFQMNIAIPQYTFNVLYTLDFHWQGIIS